MTRHSSFRILRTAALAGLVAALATVSDAQVGDAKFKLEAPGKVAAGQGAPDFTLRAPNMRFPIGPSNKATLNSQVHSPGGGSVGGDQCDTSNYDEHWQDTLCETRGAKQFPPLGCPLKTVHQGIDLRGGTAQTCNRIRGGEKRLVPIVAVEDGRIASIGSYTVTLRTNDGRKYRYMHMDMARLEVGALDTVSKGDVIGFMDNDFGGTSTTFHLHIEHWMNIPGRGIIPVPLYCDLAEAYSRLHGKPYDIVGGGQRCDGTAAPAIVEDVPALGMDNLGSFWDHNGSEMGLLAEAAQRTIVYARPRPALDGIIEPGEVLFNGQKDGNRYVGRARVFSSRCPPAAFDVSGPILNDGLRIELTGAAPQRNSACDVVGSTEQTLVFDFLRRKGEPAVTGCGADTLPRQSLTERTKNWGAITMFVPFENWLPYIRNWPGLRIDASGQPVDLGRDHLGGFIPAFETDEAGVGIWWYWLLVRKGFGPDGDPVAQPTFRQIAQGIAGNNASATALAAYTDAYVALGERYFGRAVTLDDPLDLTNAEERWALGQTMFHHEAGRAPLVSEDTFKRGIAFGTDRMKNRFQGLSAYQPDCAEDTPVIAAPDAAQPAAPVPATDDAALAARIAELESRLATLEAESTTARIANAQLNDLVSDLRSRLVSIAEIARP